MDATPIVDQARLVAYKQFEKKPVSEEWLKFWRATTVFIKSFGLSGAGTVLAITVIVNLWRLFIPIPESVASWPLGLGVSAFALVLALPAWWLNRSVEKARYLNYGYVPQGMIVAKHVYVGRDSRLKWCLSIEGFNSLNQRRVSSWTVDAGKWFDEYKAGDYVDFRDDEDREYSLPDPLPEAAIVHEA